MCLVTLSWASVAAETYMIACCGVLWIMANLAAMNHKPSLETDTTSEIDQHTWTAEIDDMIDSEDLS